MSMSGFIYDHHLHILLTALALAGIGTWWLWGKRHL